MGWGSLAIAIAGAIPSTLSGQRPKVDVVNALDGNSPKRSQQLVKVAVSTKQILTGLWLVHITQFKHQTLSSNSSADSPYLRCIKTLIGSLALQRNVGTEVHPSYVWCLNCLLSASVQPAFFTQGEFETCIIHKPYLGTWQFKQQQDLKEMTWRHSQWCTLYCSFVCLDIFGSELEALKDTLLSLLLLLLNLKLVLPPFVWMDESTEWDATSGCFIVQSALWDGHCPLQAA